MFTKQPTHVVLRHGSMRQQASASDAIVFTGSETECLRFTQWANESYQTDEYRTEVFK